MQNILVIGEALVDKIYNPQEDSIKILVGGSPANVAKGLSRLGCSVELVSWLAQDKYGKIIAQELHNDGVYLPKTIFKAEETSTAHVMITEDGSASYKFELDWQLPSMPTDHKPAWIHTGSIASVLEPGASQLLDYLSHSSLPPLSFDPNIRTQIINNTTVAKQSIHQFLAISSLVKMSNEDAQWLYPGYTSYEIWKKLQNLGVKIFALTKGEEGAEIWGPDNIHCSQPNYPGKLVDTVGAGDSFMAALIYAIMVNLINKESVDFGDINREKLAKILDFCLKVAAKTVSRAGANPPSLKEIICG